MDAVWFILAPPRIQSWGVASPWRAVPGLLAVITLAMVLYVLAAIAVVFFLPLSCVTGFKTLRLLFTHHAGDRRHKDSDTPGWWSENAQTDHWLQGAVQGGPRIDVSWRQDTLNYFSDHDHCDGRPREITLRNRLDSNVHAIWVKARPNPNAGVEFGSRRPARSPARRESGAHVPPPRRGCRAAILINGSTETLDDCWTECEFMLERGISALLLTRSGYPDPAEAYGLGTVNDNDAELEDAVNAEGWIAMWNRKTRNAPDEASMLADAEAALDWLTGVSDAEAIVAGPKKCPLRFEESRVFIEGQSLGTCAAHMLGVKRPGLGAVVVVQPFASAWRVATYAAINAVADFFRGWAPRAILVWLLWYPLSICALAVSRLAFATKLPQELEALRGMNNLEATRMYRGPYCAFYGTHDNLMSVQKDDGAGSGHFAIELEKSARAPGRISRVIEMPGFDGDGAANGGGDHGKSYTEGLHDDDDDDDDDDEPMPGYTNVRRQYTDFLIDSGMIIMPR